MPKRKKPLTQADYQRRWRAKKRKTEIAAGLRPARKKKPLTAAQRQSRWRARKAAAEVEAEEARKYAASRERRRLSRAAPQIEPEFRLGDCREVLRDIAVNSVAVVATDPAYGNASELLYRWLADFAAQVLVPGGSLICYTGSTTWFRDAAIFAAHLEPRPLLFMLHDQEQRMRGGETIRVGMRPVLWFTKGPRRRRETRPYQCEVPTLARGVKDKSLHKWQQGDAVWQWIDPLTDPGDLVVDPFCGSGEWGHICGAFGRKWIGCDIVEGGSTKVVA
jgi:hypothetical protein